MEAFKFNLQKLLDIRADKEEESKRVFKEAQNDKNRVEENLNTMQENYKKFNVISKNEGLIEQKIKKNYLNALNLSINNATVELEEKKKLLEEKREDLKQKQIDRKTVEILKEKKKIEFIKLQDHAEQIANDEFALYSFIRSREGR